MSTLECEQDDLIVIQEGIHDMEAARYQSFSQIDAEFRQTNKIPRENANDEGSQREIISRTTPQNLARATD